ncbi:stage V sporulation protein AB [Lachnospiraceae bacterium NSJ-143]|nr:stage V sporulation protein AB [Lachnospiraceae bacterium NSJ-143]
MVWFLKTLILIVIAFSSGVVIAGGVFAFIAVIGIVPRMAQRTHTENKIVLYENAIITGGVFGCLTMVFDFNIPIGYFSIIPAFAIGIFVGSLAVSIAEVLNVVPVFMRRASLKTGLGLFVASIAFGKMFGSLIYFIIPNFYK